MALAQALSSLPTESTIERLFPETIARIMQMPDAVLSCSTSGGKDSHAMQRQLVEWHHDYDWQGRLFAIHSDLGRIEWYGTLDHVRRLCAQDGIELSVVHPKRSMVDEWDKRRETIVAGAENKPHWPSSVARFCTDRGKLQPINAELRLAGDKPHWPSAEARYCTKGGKIQPIDKQHRLEGDLVVCAVGIRAQESPGRAKKPRYQMRTDITTQWLKSPADFFKSEQRSRSRKLRWVSLAGLWRLMYMPEWIAYFAQAAIAAVEALYKGAAEYLEAWADMAFDLWLKRGRKGRFALTWHPILHWTIDQVWQKCGTSRDEIDRRRLAYQAGDLVAAFAGCVVHWAYIVGSSRLSCSMCVLAGLSDLANGAKHNPLVWLELVLSELESDWSFKRDLALASLRSMVEQMPIVKLKQVWRVLHQLGLVKPPAIGLYRELLAILPAEVIVLWTAGFFQVFVNEIFEVSND